MKSKANRFKKKYFLNTYAAASWGPASWSSSTTTWSRAVSSAVRADRLRVRSISVPVKNLRANFKYFKIEIFLVMKLPRVDYFYDEARKFLTRSWLGRCAENHGIYLYSLSTFQGVHAPRSIFYHLNREAHPLHLFRPQTRWKLKNETEKFKHEENIFRNPEYITFRCNF